MTRQGAVCTVRCVVLQSHARRRVWKYDSALWWQGEVAAEWTSAFDDMCSHVLQAAPAPGAPLRVTAQDLAGKASSCTVMLFWTSSMHSDVVWTSSTSSARGQLVLPLRVM